ncbi:TonB-dependent siderophore receptor [Chitinimonas sp. BJYL2]|uniref:TonB-dependent receptor plug domain-containing protein n=1 Tax=Chitinimonas sp. BJYL2 TaxID=2976696 RepID=UPI0022B5AFA5|nr:TonB-dependent receptor [Chitinimonas sp. BJYL2]
MPLYPPCPRAPLYLLLSAMCVVTAQAADPDASAKDTTPPPKTESATKADEKINVTGRQITDTDRRRASSAAKIVVGREEIAQYGDTNLGDVLKRLPGVTLGGTPGRRGGEIRMRGLGSGYTQILLNGEPAPRGFSLDSMSPDQIERIEVMRAPTAEHSAQAIAGTINIVLREDARKRLSEAKFTLNDNGRGLQPGIALQHNDKVGSLGYTLSANFDQSRGKDESSSGTLGYAADGRLNFREDSSNRSQFQSRRLMASPRLNWKISEDDSLTAQTFIFHSDNRYTYTGQLERPLGEPAPYTSSAGDGDGSFDMLRGSGNWQRKLDEGRKLNVRFGFNANRNDNTSERREYLADGTLRLRRHDDSRTEDNGFTTGGKWSTPIGETHALALGWDADLSKRTQDRKVIENGVPQITEFGDVINASTRKLAAFVQDEWDINPQWSAYGGVRWESITVESRDKLTQIERTSSVVSPTFHTVWRIPGKKNDQIRANLTRSYRAPNTWDLAGRPYVSTDNSPTNPDRSGNPNLQPELAWGLEVAYEHYLSQNGLVSANLFTRRIDQLIRRQTSQQADGRWLNQPVNLAGASTRGVELEAKFRIGELIESDLQLDVRANLSQYWSSVDGIPGPNNRLDRQAKQTANLGVDYRFRSVPLTIGANYNWVPGYTVQTSSSETSDTGPRRVLDAYALWRFGPAAQLRVSGSNLSHADSTSGSTLQQGGVYRVSSNRNKTFVNWNATLELKF